MTIKKLKEDIKNLQKQATSIRKLMERFDNTQSTPTDLYHAVSVMMSKFDGEVGMYIQSAAKLLAKASETYEVQKSQRTTKFVPSQPSRRS